MILKRYINTEIIKSTLAILVVLILIFISTRFIKYIQLAVDGTISSGAVFKLMALQIPTVAGFLIPLSFFIAILLTLGRLYSENEMAVLKSVGVGERMMIKFILPVALGLSLVSAGLSFWVTPWSNLKAKTLLATEKAEAEMGAFLPGRFHENKSKDGVVFVESKDEQGSIRRLFSVSGLNQASEELNIQVAAQGDFLRVQDRSVATKDQLEDSINQLPKGSYMWLTQGQHYRFDKTEKHWQVTDYQSYFMRVPEEAVKESAVKTKALSSIELLSSRTLAAWAEIHWRLSAPLSIPILVLLAVPLARSQPRQGKFARLGPAILLYLIYAVLMMNTRQLIVDAKIPVELGYWWIHASFLVAALWLLKPSKFKPLRRRQANV
ncbi:LPS export ABC transporter permease LptF [Aliikangiella sp. IMCC44632]